MKDYQKIIETLKEEQEITTKTLKELGYSPYDIKNFVESGIISRAKKGVYTLGTKEELQKGPEQAIVKSKKAIKPTEKSGPQTEEPPSEEIQPTINYINQGITYIIKRDYVSARKSFNNQLDLTPNNNRALYGVFATYIYEEKYESAYEALVASINEGFDDTVAPNYYVCLELLKEYIEVDEELIENLLSRISQIKTAKMGSNNKKMIKAIQDKDYKNVFRFINYNISFDKKGKKYHLTNQVLRKLCENILRKKGLYQEKEERIVKKESDSEIVTGKTPHTNQNSSQPEVLPEEQPVSGNEQIVIVPQIQEEHLIPSLLIEAINKNDYKTALSILESSNIENPKEVIKILLEKLQLIKSLLTSEEPLKVVKAEPVAVVAQENLLIEEPANNGIKLSESKNQSEEFQEVIKTDLPAQDESDIKKTTSPETPIDSSEDKQPTEESQNQNLADIAYQAYKDTFWSEDFVSALQNLRRYDYIMASTGQKRNLTYHYKRIEENKKDYETNPENYLHKKDLANRIFGLKVAKKYNEALALIKEYKGLPGYKVPNVIICEAEIYYAKGDYSGTKLVLKSVASSEEPTYYYLLAHLDYKLNKSDEALQSCFAYNERRPHATVAIYNLMGDIYKRKGKAGKAVKTYRIAKEIAAKLGKNTDVIQSKINNAESQAEHKRGLRLGLNY